MTELYSFRPIQWYPGHMAKSRRKIQQALGQVDMVIELLDARIPLSSQNPELDKLSAGKPRLVVLNKADLADEAVNLAWIACFQSQGKVAIATNCKTGRSSSLTKQLVSAMEQVLADKLAVWREKGMTGRPMRAMVVGIPNVGKSSFINCLAAGSKAKVEDRPGVTRSNQWFVIASGTAHLLDTPGVLWPKFEDQTVARHLAYTGAIRDEILDTEELAAGLLSLLYTMYSPLLAARYKLTQPELEQTNGDGFALLELIGRKRGMLMSGGVVDTERASLTVLDEFRGGKIGRISLEKPAGEWER